MIAVGIDNCKGGVAKTSTAAIFSFLLAKQGKSVLSIDGDAQGNLTQALSLTSKIMTGKQPVMKSTMMDAISKGNLNRCLMHLAPKWDLLPNAMDFYQFKDFMNAKFSDNPVMYRAYFWTLLAPIADKYNYIVIDFGPFQSLGVTNMLYDCDYSLLVAEPTAYGYSGCRTFLEYMNKYILNPPELRAPHLKILGILPVKVRYDSTGDRAVLSALKDTYTNVIPDFIPVRQRIKTFTNRGIDDKEYYSKDALSYYSRALNDVENLIKAKSYLQIK